MQPALGLFHNIGGALLALCALVIGAELPLEQPIDATHLLLLAQLDSVV